MNWPTVLKVVNLFWIGATLQACVDAADLGGLAKATSSAGTNFYSQSSLSHFGKNPLYLTPMVVGPPIQTKPLAESIDEVEKAFGRGSAPTGERPVVVGFSVGISYMNLIKPSTHASRRYDFDDRPDNSIADALNEAGRRNMPVVINLNANRFQEISEPCGHNCTLGLLDWLSSIPDNMMRNHFGIALTEMPAWYYSETHSGQVSYPQRVGSYLFALNEYASGGDSASVGTPSYRFYKKKNLQQAAGQIGRWLKTNPDKAHLVVGITIDSEVSLCAAGEIIGNGNEFDYGGLNLTQYRYWLAGTTLPNGALSFGAVARENPYVFPARRFGQGLNLTLEQVNARHGTHNVSWYDVTPPRPPFTNINGNLTPAQRQAALDWMAFKKSLVRNLLSDSLNWVSEALPSFPKNRIFTHQPEPKQDASLCGLSPDSNHVDGFGFGITTYGNDVQNPNLFQSLNARSGGNWGVFEWNPHGADLDRTGIAANLRMLKQAGAAIVVPNYFFPVQAAEGINIFATPVTLGGIQEFAR